MPDRIDCEDAEQRKESDNNSVFGGGSDGHAQMPEKDKEIESE